jgi:hypothetical protein
VGTSTHPSGSSQAHSGGLVNVVGRGCTTLYDRVAPGLLERQARQHRAPLPGPALLQPGADSLRRVARAGGGRPISRSHNRAPRTRVTSAVLPHGADTRATSRAGARAAQRSARCALPAPANQRPAALGTAAHVPLYIRLCHVAAARPRCPTVRAAGLAADCGAGVCIRCVLAALRFCCAARVQGARPQLCLVPGGSAAVCLTACVRLRTRRSA